MFDKLRTSVSQTGSCPYCAKPARFSFSARDWNQHSTDRRFDYYRCSACGLRFQHPPVLETAAGYVQEQYDIPRELADYPARAESQRWKLELIQPHITGPDLLEIGPATGEFATVAREAGNNVKVIEMNQGCCAFLRALGHSVVETGDPASWLDGSRLFDTICIW